MKREPAEPQGFIKLTGVGIPRLQAGEDVKQYGQNRSFQNSRNSIFNLQKPTRPLAYPTVTNVWVFPNVKEFSMSLLAHVVDWLVPFICGGVATVLGLMWRWGKAMVNGLRELLLCQLEDLRREMVIEHDGVADEDLKARSQRLYDSYHSLGGNGHGTALNNDIQSAPIAPRQS